ncbi:hypothetical protein [Bifidobacterium pseudolongum]|nr:hypothetical protein [Bifidobacterium pseudolongum]
MENQQVEQHYGELLDGGDWWAVLEINYDYARSVHLDTGKNDTGKL